MTNTDKQLLDAFMAVVGIGNVTGPYGPFKDRKHSPLWSWGVGGKGATRCLTPLLPWLSQRRLDKIRWAEAQAGVPSTLDDIPDLGEGGMAWAAGWYEAEGHARFQHDAKRQSGRLRLRINNTNLDPQERFARIVGCGRIYGPLPTRSLFHTPQWAWQCNGDEARRLMPGMMRWLTTRRRTQYVRALRLWSEYRGAVVARRMAAAGKDA